MVDLTPEQERMHALTNSIPVQAYHLSVAKDKDDYLTHVSALQAINHAFSQIAGVETDVLDLIRMGIGWADGRVRSRGVDLGVI